MGLMRPEMPCQARALNTDRAAWVLIRRFGDDALLVAEKRRIFCIQQNRTVSAAEWARVQQKVCELSQIMPAGRRH